MTGSPEEQQAVERQRQLQAWATSRVKSWGELQRADYDFGSWAKKASKNCLRAGALYEYARESRKLRCLVALMNRKRPREIWEIVRPGMIDGKTPSPDEIDSYPAEANWLPCSFEDLDEHDAERAIYGFLYCLVELADYLANNVSFADLFCTKRVELDKAFGGLDNLTRVTREFRYFMPVLDSVEVATRSQAEQAATVLETITGHEKRIVHGEACSEVIAVRVHWRFTNSEIAAGMEKLAREHRPQNDTYKARQPKKGSRCDSVRAALDCLSAMRLASYLPKTSATADKAAFAAYSKAQLRNARSQISGNSIKFQPSAIDLFDEVRLGGRGNSIAESNFDGLIVKARKFFEKSFPFGEDPANKLPKRIMLKSERISA